MGNVVCVMVDATDEIQKLIRKKVISSAKCGDKYIIARHGVNKSTLKRIANKVLKNEG